MTRSIASTDDLFVESPLNVIKPKDAQMPAEKPNAKPKKFDEDIIRRIACHHFICKMDDEALKWSFEVHLWDLKLMQSDPAWSDQIKYLRRLQCLPVIEDSGFNDPTDAFHAMMTAHTGANKFDLEVMEPWYQQYVEPHFKLLDGPEPVG
jgi:hypothetical protein